MANLASVSYYVHHRPATLNECVIKQKVRVKS